MLDLAITGGTLVIPGEGIVAADVGVVGEQVALLAAPGGLPEAARTLSATGRHVFPGVVDPHVHFVVHTSFEQDLEYETRAALAGGPPARYEPQRSFLALLNTADGKAILRWRGVATHARFAWWLKDWIDRRFMRAYQSVG